MKVCGKANPDSPNETCVSDEGHRGRHAYRATIPTEEVGMTSGPGVPTKDEVLSDLREEGASIEEIKEALSGDDEPKGWSPGADVMLNLKGKMYLPARRRVQWLRGEPKPHPDWTIDTETEVFERGKFIRPGRVEGGFAVVRASIFDADGRLIATGVKSEYSENFADFLEKAETGAIARALAVAGYGTESALDFDEGLDKERIADSPVEAPTRPVTISPSAVPGVGRGGKTDGASVAQIRRVSELSKELELGAEGLATVIEGLLGSAPELPSDEAAAARTMTAFLADRSSAEVGKLIDVLDGALKSKA